MDEIVFFLDFDNTLIDHDAFKRSMGDWIAKNAAHPGEARFWELYEAVRTETEIVDIPETISRFAFEAGSQPLHRELVRLTWDFPFRDITFPGAIETIWNLREMGTAVVLCDGQEAFQRHKLQVTGVADAVGHNIVVCVHKEEHITEVTMRFPARHYVMIDDKPRIHRTMKRALGDSVTTVLVRFGAYAGAESRGSVPEVDLEVDSIADLTGYSARKLRGLAKPAIGAAVS